jgi:hypothetical protein
MPSRFRTLADRRPLVGCSQRRWMRDKPGGQAAAELVADPGHRRPGKRADLLKAEVVDLQPGYLAVLPAANDRLGDLVGVDADLLPAVLGPGAQLTRQVDHEHQLIDQTAGRLGNSRVQRGQGHDQDGAGLELASGGGGSSKPR